MVSPRRPARAQSWMAESSGREPVSRSNGPKGGGQPSKGGAVGHVELSEADRARQTAPELAQRLVWRNKIRRDHLMPELSQVPSDVRDHEPGRAGDEDGVRHQLLAISRWFA